MSLTDQLKSAVKRVLRPQPKPMTDFSPQTLPWIDKPNADIDAYLRTFGYGKNLSYNLADKLRFWQKNGYVILEQALEPALVDKLWTDVEELFTNNEKYPINIQVDRPEYAGRAVQEARNLPKEVLNGPYIKVMDFHNSSVAGKNIMLHNNIVTFLEAVFGDKVVAMQSLLFKYGSQQATHQDFAYVVSEVPSHLAASWVALEDVHIDSGPLFYYPGSHHNAKFNFGNGMFFNAESSLNPTDFAKFIEQECEKRGQKRETLLIKKGDVLIWHAALAHGGDAIRNPALTRKSFVSHYSSNQGYKHHRSAPTAEPVRFTINGADVFANPRLPEQEDIFK